METLIRTPFTIINDRTQDWLKKNLMEVWEKGIWPFSSPSCSPADYFVQGVSKFRVRAQLYN
jgi:hypothetical protein